MKAIIALFFFVSPFVVFAQNSDLVTFYGGDIYFKFIDVNNGEIVRNKPIGKVYDINYNTFYRSYSVLHNFMGESDAVINFDFIKTNDDRSKLYIENSVLNDRFIVIDFHLFDDRYWQSDTNVTGTINFIGMEIHLVDGRECVMAWCIEKIRKERK